MEVDDRPNRPKKPMLTYWVIAIIVFFDFKYICISESV